MNVLPSYRPKASYPSGSGTSKEVPSPQPRKLLATRPIYWSGNVTSQSTGSATCELGKTKVLCSIHGPRPRRQAGRAEFSGRGAIDVEATFAPFARPQTQTKEELERVSRELSTFLENCLESSVQLARFPKSVLDVYLVVLEDDGSSYACAALCASYALAKAGVEMFDIVSCCNLYLSKSGEIGVDPDLAMEKDALALCTVGILAGSGKLTCLEVSGSESYDSLLVAKFISIGSQACVDVAQIMRAQLKQEALVEIGNQEEEAE